jgi:hypothetical protein
MNKKQNKLIPPDEFNDLVKNVQLSGIYFKSGQWSINHDLLDDKNILTVGFDIDEINEDSNSVKFSQKFNLSLTAEEKKRAGVKISVEIVTHCIAEKEMTAKFWNTYKEVSLPIISVPFFREYIYNLTGKMDIHPITVPPWTG